MTDVRMQISQVDSVLTVSVTGTFGIGSKGNAAAKFILAEIDAALNPCPDQNPPEILIIDLSKMDYQWGDAIALIFHKYRPYNPTILLGQAQADAWTSLLSLTLSGWREQTGIQIRFV